MFLEVTSGSDIFLFSYSPPGKLRGDYFQDKDFSQVLFNKEPSWNSKVCYLLNDKVGFTGGYAI